MRIDKLIFLDYFIYMFLLNNYYLTIFIKEENLFILIIFIIFFYKIIEYFKFIY
jgi:hypothetical protein